MYREYKNKNKNMNVIVTSEFRFFQTPDGTVWTPSSFPYKFWLRYLQVFDHVIVIARIKHVTSAKSSWVASCGKNVTFSPLPYYVGILGLLKVWPKLMIALYKVSSLNGIFLCRVPSQTANLLTFILRLKLFNRRKYALEVVGDPHDVFATGIGGKLAPMLQYFSQSTLKRQCQHACAVSYVTEYYLQKRYPAGIHTFESYYSSIMLDDSQIRKKARVYQRAAKNLLFVGSLDQLYKAPDILLMAFAKLAVTDKHYQLTLLGQGKFMSDLQKLTQQLGIEQQVNFVGEVNSNEVGGYLHRADLFVLPSRTEGLPRAMIEAMAQGLPCVGSTAGGIPELLPKEYCIEIASESSLNQPLDDQEQKNEQNSIEKLYDVLKTLSTNTELLQQQSRHNLNKAKQYHNDILVNKRTVFYRKIRELNE